MLGGACVYFYSYRPCIFCPKKFIRFSLPLQSRIEMPNIGTKSDAAKCVTAGRTNGAISLEQRVFEFDKTAQYMIKKLITIREQIDGGAGDVDALANMKMSISPDAATLISQGDTLVLETHGKSTELSNTVMQAQSVLRDKFREMKSAQ